MLLGGAEIFRDVPVAIDGVNAIGVRHDLILDLDVRVVLHPLAEDIVVRLLLVRAASDVPPFAWSAKTIWSPSLYPAFSTAVANNCSVSSLLARLGALGAVAAAGPPSPRSRSPARRRSRR